MVNSKYARNTNRHEQEITPIVRDRVVDRSGRGDLEFAPVAADPQVEDQGVESVFLNQLDKRSWQ